VGGHRPELVREGYALDRDTVTVVRRALWDVVNGGGTGTSARVEGFDVAGKTGTAQVVASASYGSREDFEDHAWFVGFAPFDDPEIAVGIFVENGGHGGSAAGPVARAIFETYFNKQTARIAPNDAVDPAAEVD